jgi:pimeloyl-ACP methyl ester carboxylesterase
VTATAVLVHGAWHGAWCFDRVLPKLMDAGIPAIAVDLPGHGADPGPLGDLHGDAVRVGEVLETLDGEVVLLGHSYGGAVITEAGNHSSVAALVYITAFAPDKGESVNTLIADPPPGAPVPPILPPRDGFLFLDRDKFAASFAADVPAAQAAFMADSQVPWGVDALGGAVSEPAWRTKPSWYLLVTDDRMIPLPAQRAMSERAGSTVTETPGSHAIYVSNPAVVAAVIAQAAAAVNDRS